jgi:hypothetical protein
MAEFNGVLDCFVRKHLPCKDDERKKSTSKLYLIKIKQEIK